MAAERWGVVKRVESAGNAAVLHFWMNYNLWFVNSSWGCQSNAGQEVSQWQRTELKVSTRLKASLNAAAVPQKTKLNAWFDMCVPPCLMLYYMTVVLCEYIIPTD